MSKPSFVNSQECVLFHDYTTGSVRDWSGNGNHSSSFSGIKICKKGVQFDETGYIEVDDSAELQGNEFALVAFGQFTKMVQGSFITKRDSGGINYDFYYLSDRFSVYDGSSVRNLFCNFQGSNYIAANIKSGDVPQGYVDGVFAGNFSGAISFTADDAPVTIGNFYSHTNAIDCISGGFLIFNRTLTSTEHQQLYGWLNSLTAQSKPYHNLTTLDDKQLFKTGYGAHVSTETMSETLTGTPFKIQSGSFKIVDDEIEGRPVKAIECVTAGAIYIPVDVTQQSKSDAAYGEWLCNVYLASSLTSFYWHFIWDDNADTGYYFYIGVNGNVIMRKVESGSTTTLFSTAIGYAPILTNLELRITRSAAGTFTAYINNDIIVAGTGSNPVTDNTNTDSFMQQWGHAAGDKICLGDRNGNYSITKETL